MWDPTSAVELILDDLGIAGPDDLQMLDLIVWARRAVVQYRHLDGAEARIVIGGRRAVITVCTEGKSPRRTRFTVAHELGHLEMGRWQRGMIQCTSEDIVEGKHRPSLANSERLANEFAAALLLPERFFTPLCQDVDPSLNLIADLADQFNVSLTATALRFVRFFPGPCAVAFCQDRGISWFQGSPEFEDLGVFIEVGNAVHSSTCAAALFRKPKLQPMSRPVRADAWFEPSRYCKNATIQEHSLLMPDYNSVLTLLWFEDEIEGEDDYA